MPARPVMSGPTPAGTRRMLRRRRRAAALGVFLVSAVLVGMDLAQSESTTGPPVAGNGASGGPGVQPGPVTPLAFPGISPFAGAESSAPATIVPGPTGATPDAEPLTTTPLPDYPETGPGTFRHATGQGRLLGSAGVLRRYRVAVEDGTGQRANAFATAIAGILGDDRSWVASSRLRLRRVPASASAEFTIYLATPATAERMCGSTGQPTERFTSCRTPGKVIINLARWLTAVPGYGAGLEVYQAYVINHEIGHQLGEGHQGCPAEGRLAPVMMQQAYGLAGCRANAWPYPDGRRRYVGPAVD